MYTARWLAAAATVAVLAVMLVWRAAYVANRPAARTREFMAEYAPGAKLLSEKESERRNGFEVAIDLAGDWRQTAKAFSSKGSFVALRPYTVGSCSVQSFWAASDEIGYVTVASGRCRTGPGGIAVLPSGPTGAFTVILVCASSQVTGVRAV